jgi:vacuolar-type H+-ATPase subunit B/Vma2
MMEELYAAYEKAAEYPRRTLLRQQQYAHVERQYVKNLDDREEALFEDEDETAVDIWEWQDEKRDMKLQRVTGLAELTKHLRVSTLPSYCDPRCRYV